MRKIKLAIMSLALLVGVAAVFVPSYAMADPASEIKGGVNSIGGGNEVSLGDRIKTIVNVLMFILGAIAVIMIIIGGFRYVTSSGESAALTSAKNTILYSVVGLIVAILAYAIVNFVIDNFS